jgi:hypothetical protein
MGETINQQKETNCFANLLMRSLSCVQAPIHSYNSLLCCINYVHQSQQSSIWDLIYTSKTPIFMGQLTN